MTLGGPPVTILDAGGLPVTPTTVPGGVPFTVIAAGGMPITIADGAFPVSLLDEDGTPWSDAPHASDLLDGETQGLAIDFTLGSGLGEVAVIDTTTPANNKSNVPVDQFLTQSGTSPKLVMGADGLYHWSPHNLLPESQTLDAFPTWQMAGGTGTITGNAATAPDGTLTAERINEPVGFSINAVQTTVATVEGATYTVAICFKRAVGVRWAYFQLNCLAAGVTASAMYFDISGAGAVGSTEVLIPGVVVVGKTIQSLGDGWYRCSVSFVGGANLNVFAGSCDGDGSRTLSTGGGSIYVWGAQLNRGETALAYHATTAAAWFGVPIEYGGGGYYALVEPQATNILLQSQALDTWVPNGATVTANAVAAPDGTATADKIVEDNAINFHNVNPGLMTVAASTVYTHSFFAKAAERSAVVINTIWPGVIDEPASFDLANGVVASIAPQHTSATITPVGNGWYRCTVTLTAGVGQTSTGHIIGPLAAVGGSSVYQGVPGQGLYVWGAQVELGAVATSPIPTFAATVTRAADALGFTGASFPYSETAGTWWIEFTHYVATVNNLVGTSVVDQPLLYQPTGLVSSYDGASFVATANASTINVKSEAAIGWSGATRSVVLNGSAVATGAYDGSWGAVDFGLGYSRKLSANWMIGRLHRTYFIPRRKTDVEIQTETAP